MKLEKRYYESVTTIILKKKRKKETTVKCASAVQSLEKKRLNNTSKFIQYMKRLRKVINLILEVKSLGEECMGVSEGGVDG